MTVAEHLTERGLSVPQPWRLPDGVHRAFELVRVHGSTVHVAGHGPVDGDVILMHGCVGAELTVDEGYESARLTGLSIISSLAHAIGDVDALVWLTARVYVNAAPGLGGPALTRVADGFSDVVNAAFGERGMHARATVGANALAFGVPTIVEATLALDRT